MIVNTRAEFKPVYVKPPVSGEILGNNANSLNTNSNKPIDLVALKSKGLPANRIKVQSGDSLSKMLLNRGFSVEELMAKDKNGKTMLDKVAAQNGLRNANLLFPGQSLSLPNKKAKGKEAESQVTKQTQTTSLSDRITDAMLPGLKYQNMKVGDEKVTAEEPKKTKTTSLSDRITDAMLPGLKYQNMKVGDEKVTTEEPKQTKTTSLSDRITDAMLPGLKYQNMKVGTVDF